MLAFIEDSFPSRLLCEEGALLLIWWPGLSLSGKYAEGLQAPGSSSQRSVHASIPKALLLFNECP